MDRRSNRFLVWLFVWCGVFLHLSGPGWAQSAGSESFSSFEDAYSAYKAAVDTENYSAALPSARQAYELARERFGRMNSNVAALAMNYGRMLQIADADDPLAGELFAEADAIYEALLGPDSLERVASLMALASAQATHEDKLTSIRAALRVHRAVLPEDDVGYARQQTGGAEILNDSKAGYRSAMGLLSDALRTFEAEFGRDSTELVPTLFAMGSVSSNEETFSPRPRSGLGSLTADALSASRTARRYFDRALELIVASESNGPEDVADFELRIGIELAEKSSNYPAALPYFRSAQAGFAEALGTSHPRTALAALVLGETLVIMDDGKDAVIHLENAVRVLELEADYRPSLIRAHRALMSVLLIEDEDERFTEQLNKVGSLLLQTTETLGPTAIIEYLPEYPSRAFSAGGSGSVVVEFRVDNQGHVGDPVVIESRTARGESGEIFHEAAIEAIQKYRYIPRFENGVAVSASGVRETIEFERARNSSGDFRGVGVQRPVPGGFGGHGF